MTKEQTEHLRTISYSGIFLSCFSDYSEKCIHATPEHTLVYLFSREQVIRDRNETIILQAGECAFIRRDHGVMMYKNSKGEELYKGISLTFKRNVMSGVCAYLSVVLRLYIVSVRLVQFSILPPVR